MTNVRGKEVLYAKKQKKYVLKREVSTLIVRFLDVDNFYIEKGCNKEQCPFNDGGMCSTGIGCMYYEVDFLNSITGTQTGEVTNDTFKSFIE